MCPNSVRGWIVVLTLTACAHPVPSHDHPVAVADRSVTPPPSIEIGATEPDRYTRSSLLDRADELWPLIREPALEPHAPLAQIYRASGSWTRLCDVRGEPRGADRDEALAYLDTWCRIGSRTVDETRTKLRELTGARSFVIARAAQADLIDVLAWFSASAVEAIGWLHAGTLDQPTTLDALAATYLALGRDSDARDVVKQLLRSHELARRIDCRSLYRARALLREPWIRDEIEERKPDDPICLRVADVLDDEDDRRRR